MTAGPEVASVVEHRSTPLPRGGRPRLPALAVFAVAVAGFALLPLLTGQHLTGLVGRFLVFALVAVSLDLLWGYAGQLSLGHAAFFGLGAYAAGLVLTGGGGVARSALALALAVAVPAGAALVMGYLLFRGGVGGVYFAIVTLLVSLLLEQLAITWISFTGGINGLFGMAPLDLGVVTISSLTSAYYLVLVVVTVAFAAVVWLTRTPYGRALTAIRSHEHRAHSLGLSIVTVKTVVFTVSCGLAGLAGFLYVPLERFVYPTQLGLVASTSVVVWVVIGGRGTLVGPVLGAIVVEYLASALSGALQGYWLLVIGLFLVVVVLFRPGGLHSILAAAWSGAAARIDRRRRPSGA
jgi:urea transport system permease protein